MRLQLSPAAPSRDAEFQAVHNRRECVLGRQGHRASGATILA